MTSTPPSLENPKFMSMQTCIFFKSLNVSYSTEKSVKCALEAFHMTLKVSYKLDHNWLQTRCDVIHHAPTDNSDLRKAQQDFPPSADKCENSLLVSNSAHTSFCTVKLKHPREAAVSENTFLSEGGR